MELCHIFSLMLICMTLSTSAQSQQIIADPEVTAYLGGDVTLHCRLQSESTVKITQVQWTWESTEKKKEDIVIHNPAHKTHYFNSAFSGRVVYTNQSLGHVSINITGVKLTDKGKFTCQYTTFPNGIMKTTTTLIVKAKKVQGQSSHARVTGILVCVLLLISCLPIAVIVMTKNSFCRRILQAANPRPASPSVVYENARDLPGSELSMDCTYTTVSLHLFYN
uniref:Ig-like domain-containing protein n=1 Tax=Scleropages formosus TaxID=113540 RepID=A0A8C9U6J5_SCLFO